MRAPSRLRDTLSSSAQAVVWVSLLTVAGAGAAEAAAQDRRPHSRAAARSLRCFIPSVPLRYDERLATRSLTNRCSQAGSEHFSQVQDHAAAPSGAAGWAASASAAALMAFHALASCSLPSPCTTAKLNFASMSAWRSLSSTGVGEAGA